MEIISTAQSRNLTLSFISQWNYLNKLTKWSIPPSLPGMENGAVLYTMSKVFVQSSPDKRQRCSVYFSNWCIEKIIKCIMTRPKNTLGFWRYVLHVSQDLFSALKRSLKMQSSLVAIANFYGVLGTTERKGFLLRCYLGKWRNCGFLTFEEYECQVNVNCPSQSLKF